MLCCTEYVSIEEISAHMHSFEFKGSKNISR